MTGELRIELAKLGELRSQSTPILSVYLNLYPERTMRGSIPARLHQLLKPIKASAESGDLSHDASMSLRKSVDRLLSMAPELSLLPGTGVALFVCPAIALDEQLSLPTRTWDCAMVGPHPYLRPLEAVVDEFRRVAGVVIDSRHAELVVFDMGEPIERQRMEAEEIRTRRHTGWHGLEEKRMRSHAEEVHHQLFREVAEQLERLRRVGGIELVFVGGKEKTTAALMPFLEPKVRAITETFIIDLHTLTPAILTKTVARLETEYGRREAGRAVDAVYAQAAEGDLAVIGVERVAEAVNRNAVAQLLVDDGATTPGAVCTFCGAISRPRDTCGACSKPTKPVADLIEVLARAVIEAGGKVKPVMTKSLLKTDMMAARLRFRIW